LSRAGAYQFLVLGEHGETSPTILITDYSDDNYYVNEIKNATPNLLHLKFDDVLNGPSAPTEKNVKTALDFGLVYDKLVVCCMAGISRSSAIGLVIAVQRLGIDVAFKCLNPYLHYPNVTVVKLGSQILNKPDLMPAYRTYLKEVNKRRSF
jgi:predicted protein tyrosine phosphatase